MRHVLLFVIAEIYQKNDSEIPPTLLAMLNEQERLLLLRRKGEMRDEDSLLTLFGGSNRDILEALYRRTEGLTAEEARAKVSHQAPLLTPSLVESVEITEARWREKEKPFLDSLLADFPDPLRLADILLEVEH